MVEPALVGVGVCAASVLIAVLLGLILGRGAERLFGGRRSRPSAEPEDAEPEDAEPESAEPESAEPEDAEAPNL